MTQSKPFDPDWLKDLPELLQGAAGELRALAETGAAPLRRELDLATQNDLERLRSLLVRIESRVSELEQRLDALEGKPDEGR